MTQILVDIGNGSCCTRSKFLGLAINDVSLPTKKGNLHDALQERFYNCVSTSNPFTVQLLWWLVFCYNSRSKLCCLETELENAKHS